MHTFLCIIDHDVRVDIFNASSATILNNLPQMVSEQTQPKWRRFHAYYDTSLDININK